MEKLAKGTEGLVATVGKIEISPNAANVVAGTAVMTLDARHPHDAVRLGSGNALIETANAIADRRRLAVQCTAQMDQPAVSMDERLTAYLVDAMEATGLPPKRMHSGAGHDAMVMAAPHAHGNAVSAQSRRHQPSTLRRPCAPKTWRQRCSDARLSATSCSRGSLESNNAVAILPTRSTLHHLGATRSSLKTDHLLQTPDTFIRTPLPGAENVEFIVHVAPQLGARFTQMTAEFATGGTLGPAPAQRFLYVIDGEMELTASGRKQVLSAGGFAYLPQGTFAHRAFTGQSPRRNHREALAAEPAQRRRKIVVGNEARSLPSR